MTARSATILYLDTGPWLGGAQRSMVTLINALDWDRWHPLVVAADDSLSGLLYECRLHRIPCEHVRFRHWPRRPGGVLPFVRDVLRFRLAFRRLRRETPIDLVHANTARAGLLACFGLPANMPLVVHDRDVRMPRPARRLLARRAACVVALSRTVAQSWSGMEGVSIELVPNGFDIGALEAVGPTSRIALTGGSYNVVQVADLVPWKRHRLFLEALGLARVRAGGIRGLIIGRPLNAAGQAYLAELRAWCRARGLDGDVEFVTDCENAVPWIAAADAVVSASEAEPFGRSVVEALAVGTPVVVTEDGGPAEIAAAAGRAARIVSASPEALAEALVAWRCPVSRLAVYSDAVRCARQFDVRRIVPRIEAIYRRSLRASASQDHANTAQ